MDIIHQEDDDDDDAAADDDDDDDDAAGWPLPRARWKQGGGWDRQQRPEIDGTARSSEKNMSQT